MIVIFMKKYILKGGSTNETDDNDNDDDNYNDGDDDNYNNDDDNYECEHKARVYLRSPSSGPLGRTMRNLLTMMMTTTMMVILTLGKVQATTKMMTMTI